MDNTISTSNGSVAQPMDGNDTIPGAIIYDLSVTSASTALDSDVSNRGADAGQLPVPGEDRGSVPLDAGIDPGEPVKKKRSKGQKGHRKGGLIGHKKASGFEGK